jgi:hypothetical protein
MGPPRQVRFDLVDSVCGWVYSILGLYVVVSLFFYGNCSSSTGGGGTVAKPKEWERMKLRHTTVLPTAERGGE